MAWIIWEIFTERWLHRAERQQEFLDDGDRFISLWIAFNGWMKGRFGENKSDRTLMIILDGGNSYFFINK